MHTSIRRILTSGLAVSALCLATACGGSSSSDGGPSSGPDDSGTPVAGGSLTVAIPDTIDGWNPDSAVQISTYQLIREVEAPLLELTPDGQDIAPGLASAWKYNAAGTQLTLTLQPGAAFSTGDPVTPADVVFSVNQWMSGAQYGALYSNFIKSAAPKGDDKVVITLTAPSSALLGVLTWSNSAIVPADFGGQSAAEFYKKPIGAGPFAIDSATDDEISLVRNEHFYAEGQPYLDSLTYEVVADTSQRLLQVQSGDAGMADRVPTDNLSAADASSSVVSVPSSSMSLISFAQTAGAPMSDPHFRKAVSLAIDRSALVDSVYEKKASVAEGLLPPNVPGDEGCPTCAWDESDVDAAKAELAQADGGDQTVELLVDSARGIDLLAAQAIQPMLKAVGIDVQIKQVDSATLLTRVAGGDYQMVIANYTAQAPTPVDPLSFVAATGYFFTGADPNVALGALVAVSSAKDLAGQAEAVAAFEKQNYDAATVVPLVSPYTSSVLGPETHGLELLPSGLYNAAGLWVSE
ncbi:ABC transporter substrate-binding protein [Nocardioides sp. CN2-186]|uniref:ABC transporter substrate-binding protein n=1 Tax=Nocardioides tweenelious TaxID=3156607 RepID=UPI0032B5C569